MTKLIAVGDTVTHAHQPHRGLGTVTATESCGWPRCTHTECVEVKWADNHPTLPQNHEASELVATNG